MATTTTLQVGTYNAQTDAFTSVLDLNDRATFFTQKVDIAEPERVWIQSWNVRYAGAPTQRWQYRNRQWTVQLFLYAAGSASVAVAALTAAIHTLYAAIDDPVASPYVFKFTPAGGTGVTYWNVAEVDHVEPYDALRWQQGYALNIQITFTTLPKGFSIPRQVLSNLAWNPGFEAASGPAVPAFADAFANVNAYAVQAGSTPTTGPNNSFADVLFANLGANLLRYYRLGLADTASAAIDSGGQGLTGTPTGSPTQQVAGGLSGDTDTCYTFAAASSQYVDLPTTGLPTGNAAIAFGGRMKFASNPGSPQYFCTYGSGAGGNHNYIGVFLSSSGAITADVGAGTVSSAAQTTGVWHDWEVTWDGTTLRLYIDGASVGTPATPGAQTIPTSSTKFRIAATANTVANGFFSGQLDEVWVANTAVGATPISNIRTAANSGASGTLSNAMSLPASARVAFGSPAWGAINTWTLRFRWVTSLTLTAYLHYTDANNYVAVQMAAGASGFKVVHVLSGVSTTIGGPLTIALQHEAWYWLTLTQYPCEPDQLPEIRTQLAYDQNGAVGASLANVQSVLADSISSVVGRPQLAASGAACVLGGVSSGAGNAVSLFGPAAWGFSGLRTIATGIASAAWEGLAQIGASGTPANTYPSGPDTSGGAARIDLPPAGTVDCQWFLYHAEATTLSPTGLYVLPVASTPATIQVRVPIKATGLGAGSSQVVWIYEYDASGNYLRATGSPSHSGNTTSLTWQVLSGSVVTGVNTAYLGFAVQVYDPSSGSANGTVWIDNVQVWDQTKTGMSSMPYCELRFPQSPAQILLSGLVGDTQAPAFFEFGTYQASWAPTGTLTYQLGRRLTPQLGARLVNASQDNTTSGTATTLSSSDYGGVYNAYTALASGNPVFGVIQTTKALLGAYHLLARFRTHDGGGNIGNISMRFLADQLLASTTFAGNYDPAATNWGAFSFPIAANNVWQVVDVGFFQIPPFAMTPLADPTLVFARVTLQWADTTGGGGTNDVGWLAYLPVDGGMITGTLNNPSNSTTTYTQKWVWVYSDGTVGATGKTPATNLSIESGPLANPAHAYGGPGTATSGFINVNPAADSYLFVDPTTKLSGTVVNQLVGYLSDASGTVLPLAVDVLYQPQYLYPL